jgi:HSP20 family protein
MNIGSLIPWREKPQIPVGRDDFYDPFAAFRREVDRVFDDVFNGLAPRALRPWNGGVVSPSIDVADEDNALVVTAELPGLDEKDFEVTLAGDVLTITGEKKSERNEKNGDAYYVERRFGSFSRSVRLPFKAGDEAVQATYDKGILTVRIPKPAEVQNAVRKIEVKTP